MPIRSRLAYTDATTGRSSGLAVSFSTIEASVTVSRIDSPRARAASRRSGDSARSNASVISRTSRGASVCRDSGYVSGNK